MDLREVKEFFRDFAIYLIIFAVMALVFVLLLSFQSIAGNSMHPTLKEGDIVLVSKFSYKFTDIKRNDIVVLKVNDKSYVKRIIGLPGDHVRYMKNVLYINDEAYTEEFLADDIVTSSFSLEDICKEDECPDGVIPENKYLVLGDNRPDSEDSRDESFGLIEQKQIKGKVFFRIWPFKEFGKVK